MKEPYGEGVASHTDPESWRRGREGTPQALTGARAGRVLSREERNPGCRRRHGERKATPSQPPDARLCGDPARSETPGTFGTSLRENREIPRSPSAVGALGRVGKSKDVIRR
jgi:RNA-directed DNA polymerase